jgi:hypothetical protein
MYIDILSVMEENEILQDIKNKLLSLLENNCGLLKYSIKNDIEGYLYCLTNNILNIYNIEIYKVGNSSKLICRLKTYNNSYFELIKVKNILYVPYKTMFETLLFIKLKKYRILSSKEFLTNYEKINEQFILIDELLKNNSGISALKKYYLYVMDQNIDNELYVIDIKMEKKINYDLKKINYETKIKDKIKKHNEEKEEGHLIYIDIPEITYNFSNELQSIIMLKKYTTTITEFVGIITVKLHIKVFDIILARLLLHDMLNGTHIKNKYFNCSDTQVEKTFEKINFYFKSYISSDKIKKAYLFDHYNEGIKIYPDKKFTIKKLKKNKGITEEEFKKYYGSKFDLLRKKLFDNNSENAEENFHEDDLNNVDSNKNTDDEIKEKINNINEIKSIYQSKFDIYRKIIDSDSDDDFGNKKIEVEKYEIKNNDEIVKSLKELYPSRYDRYTKID